MYFSLQFTLGFPFRRCCHECGYQPQKREGSQQRALPWAKFRNCPGHACGQIQQPRHAELELSCLDQELGTVAGSAATVQCVRAAVKPTNQCGMLQGTNPWSDHDRTFTWCHAEFADLQITGTLTVVLLPCHCCCFRRALQLLNKRFPSPHLCLPTCDIPITCLSLEQKDHSSAKVKHTSLQIERL